MRSFRLHEPLLCSGFLLLAACAGGGTSIDSAVLQGADETVPLGDNGLGDCLKAGTPLETIANVNLRAEASLTAPLLMVIPEGTSPTATAADNCVQQGYFRVSFAGREGWVYGAYLRSMIVQDSLNSITRDTIISRSQTVQGFSYWWGHGVWSPGSSSKGSCSGGCPDCTHSGSYGADCSGFVAKAWIVPDSNSSYTTDAHPYSTYDFKNSTVYWSRLSSSGSLIRGDAVVHNNGSSGHVAIYENTASDGRLTVYECQGCSAGCLRDTRSFSFTGSDPYVPIRRNGLSTPPPPERLDVFGIGGGGAVYQSYWNGSTWSAWGNQGAPSVGTSSDPTAVSWGDGRLDVFVRGGDNALWHKWFNGSWSAWQNLGGVLTTGADASSWGAGRLDVFSTNTSGHLAHLWYDNNTWSSWEDLGAPAAGILGDPSAVSYGDGRIDVFVRGGDNALYQKYFDGAWSVWVNLGGILNSSPDAASWGAGRLDIFALNTSNQLVHKLFNGSWSLWENLGAPTGGLSSSPGAVSWGPGRIDVFARGPNNAVYQLYFNGSWSPWVNRGGTFASGPDVASWTRL